LEEGGTKTLTGRKRKDNHETDRGQPPGTKKKKNRSNPLKHWPNSITVEIDLHEEGTFWTEIKGCLFPDWEKD